MRARNGVLELDSWGSPRASSLARPVTSAAAIRIPERLSSQLARTDRSFPTASPALFVHEGARQSLERKLKAACSGRLVVLAITDNRTAIISHAIKSGILHARIHHMFLDAPPRVVNALVQYVANGERGASALVGHYIELNGGRLARRRPRAIPLLAKGKTHDLLAIFNDLNARYFGGGCHALLTWGRKSGQRHGQARSTIKLGSYSHLERLIRIHPVLDRPWVPRYFVAYVVYHEMLHHMIPSARGRVAANVANAKGELARRILHPPELLERERTFRNYERALDWEKRHIRRLLRA